MGDQGPNGLSVHGDSLWLPTWLSWAVDSDDSKIRDANHVTPTTVIRLHPRQRTYNTAPRNMVYMDMLL
jgi:hypothetical protein